MADSPRHSPSLFAAQIGVCIRFETRVTEGMQTPLGGTDGRHLATSKLFSTPILHRASWSRRELHVADRGAESQPAAVWDVPKVQLSSTACRDRDYAVAAVFHLHPMRVRVVSGAVVRRPCSPDQRDLVGHAISPAAVRWRRGRVSGLGARRIRTAKCSTSFVSEAQLHGRLLTRVDAVHADKRRSVLRT
jgi:hypothetical protein